MLRNFVKCALPAPGAVNVGSTLTLGAPPTGFSSWLGAFGGSATAYFFLSDGADRTIAGVWTINATTPETATISQILWNRRLGGTAGETFSTACTAWNEVPAEEQTLLRSGPFAGLRNVMINGNPLVNQRSWMSGAAVGAANTYTLDRWRVVVSGQAISWIDSTGIRTVTAPAGGVEQVVEGFGLLGGVYTASWLGTASLTINGAAIARGGQVTLPGGTDAMARFSSGTFEQFQLEPGPLATPFERRPLAAELVLCQRYYEQVTVWWLGDTVAATTYGAMGTYKATKRVLPTLTIVSAAGAGNGGMNTRTLGALNLNAMAAFATPASPGPSRGFFDVYAASAEL